MYIFSLAMNFKSSSLPMDFGGLSMKPNFEKMSRQELRAYVLANREDMAALEFLFSRRTPDSEATWFHPPKTKEEEQAQFELFKQMVAEQEGKKDSKN
jgi:hypothetical protein